MMFVYFMDVNLIHVNLIQSVLVTDNNLYSVKENLENLCSYYIYKQNKKSNIESPSQGNLPKKLRGLTVSQMITASP